MYSLANCRTLSLICLLAILFPSLSCFLLAFDTGHHHDLTASAMKSLGFNDNAMKVAQLENWLVDYYSSQPTAGLKADLEKLHFDNLADSSQVKNYWNRLTVNAKAAFEKAAKEGDAIRVVALLGMSLHAVQDFYTHSNWVEEHSIPVTGCLTDTYFDNAAVATSPTLHTGRYPNREPLQSRDHGDGTSGGLGMNHDSYTRARWDRAYVYAFCASRQWIEAARSCVEAVPGGREVWAKTQSLSLTPVDQSRLTKELLSAYRISEYAPGGHWKGPGSEHKLEFAGALAQFAASSDSIFVGHFKKHRWHKELTDGLESTEPVTSVPMIPALKHPFVAVQVKTLMVKESPLGVREAKIDVGGKPDFYAKVTIDDQMLTESMQRDQANFAPSWISIAFVPEMQSDVVIRYDLWDEDGGIRGDDELCDISANSGKRGLISKMNLSTENLTGEITGVHNRDSLGIESEGKPPDRGRAKVKLVISKAELIP